MARAAPPLRAGYVDLDPEEEALVLASLDPLAAMAGTDDEQLRALLDGVTVDSDDLAAMLKALRPRPLGRTDPDLVPPVPDEPYVKPGELWLLGDHRMVVGDATDPGAVARLLDGAEPRLLVTDPPYGVRLDPRWRNGVYNALGESAAPYMLSHQNTDISGDTIVDWSPAFELVPSIEVAYVWHAGVHGARGGPGHRAPRSRDPLADHLGHRSGGVPEDGIRTDTGSHRSRAQRGAARDPRGQLSDR